MGKPINLTMLKFTLRLFFMIQNKLFGLRKLKKLLLKGTAIKTISKNSTTT